MKYSRGIVDVWVNDIDISPLEHSLDHRRNFQTNE